MFPQLDPAALRLIGIVLILFGLCMGVIIYACCVVAGQCTREEEKRDGRYY